jgi:hypothetical protein
MMYEPVSCDQQSACSLTKERKNALPWNTLKIQENPASHRQNHHSHSISQWLSQVGNQACFLLLIAMRQAAPKSLSLPFNA